MIEPRGITAHIHRRESSSLLDGSNSNNFFELLVEHEEPERPIHPALEYEVLALRDDDDDDDDDDLQQDGDDNASTSSRSTRAAYYARRRKRVKLIVSFIFLVIAGTGNAVASKLQAIPMYNYPNFLNLCKTFIYIPICFAYIIPVARYGWFHQAITPQQINLPKRPLIIMGALDCLAASMQVFASVYLPGPLLVLLPQAAIPCSMILSRYYRVGERYRWTQYVGALVVVLGILVVLEPVLSHRRAPDFYCEAIDAVQDCTICRHEASEDSCLSHLRRSLEDDDDELPFSSWAAESHNHSSTATLLCQWTPYKEAEKKEEGLTFVWSLVMLASVIPMTLSTLYKEVALGGYLEIDPVYLNGWIAVFQFFFALIVAIPAGIFSSPSVSPDSLPENIWNGAQCFAGHGSIDSGCHPDDMCSFQATFFVCLALVCNVVYTFFMMFILKYGSTSLLFLALTLMVPVSNLAFALPFMPQATNLHVSDLLGLAVIVSGLVLYRFLDGSKEAQQAMLDGGDDDERPDTTLTPWFQDLIQQLRCDPQSVELQPQQLLEPLLAANRDV